MSLFFMGTERTAALLIEMAPRCKNPHGWAPHIAAGMYRFGIDNDKDFVAAYLAQLMVESDELNRVGENLNYSPQRLMQVWPKRFPNAAVAARYANNPQALANYVYADRMGNGPEASGDGWRYHGRGPIQTTGKANYLAVELAISLPLTKKPELLEEQAVGGIAAAKFWFDHRLSWLAADLPDDDQAADFITISRRINGGTEGLAKRQAYLARAKEYLGIV